MSPFEPYRGSGYIAALQVRKKDEIAAAASPRPGGNGVNKFNTETSVSAMVPQLEKLCTASLAKVKGIARAAVKRHATMLRPSDKKQRKV
jgi:hypothetical protein